MIKKKEDIQRLNCSGNVNDTQRFGKKTETKAELEANLLPLVLYGMHEN